MSDIKDLSDEELKAMHLGSMSDDELKALHPMTWADTAKDVYKGLGTGVVKGALNAAGDVGEAVMGPFGPSHHAANLMSDLGLGSRPAPEPSYGEQLQIRVPTYQPQTKPGQYSERAGEFVGNPISYVGGPASLTGRAATAAISGVGSKAGEDIGERFGAPKTGSLIGAVLGGAVPSTGMKLWTPNAAGNLHLSDVETLENKYGVPLSAGDKTGNKTLRAAESELSPNINDEQKRSFEKAAFAQVGENVGNRRVTGPGGAIDTMKQRVGQRFDDLQARNRADIDPALMQETLGIQKKYTGVPGLYGDETEKAVTGALGRLSQVYSHNGGSLTGTQYRELATEFNNAAMGADGPKSRALHEITDALHNNMERTIGRTNPDDMGAFKSAREDYKKALTLQRWGKSTQLTPAALDQADANIYGEAANVTGKSPFSELAQAGKRTISAYQTSETARRSFVESLPKAVAGTAGYLVGQHYGMGTEGGVGGLLLGSEGLGGPVIRSAMGKALMSSPVQNRLGNQTFSREMQSAASMPLSMRLSRALAQTQGQ